MFNLQDPFFRPLWLRAAIVAVCFGWAVVEGVTGASGFAVLFTAVGLYALHQFFIAWTNPPKDDDGAR